MEDHFQRRAFLSPYPAYASQLQYQPYQLRSPRYGLDRSQTRGGGRSIEGLGTLPHARLIPLGLRERQQRAAVVSRPLNLDVPASLRGGYLPLEATSRLLRTGSKAKRPRNADDRETFKKKPRKVQEGKTDLQKETNQERVKEVMMLHKLWKSGKKDVSMKDVAEDKKPAPQSAGKRKRNRKRRNQNDNKGEAKNDASAKLGGKSAKDATSTWEDFSTPVPDPKNASRKQKAKRKGESQKDDWIIASKPESENGNRVSAVTENHENSEIEQVKRHHLIDVQKAALKAVTEFIGNESDIDDSDEDLDKEMEEVEYPNTDVKTPAKGREEKAFDFFVSLFNENQELHKVYEECCNRGTFECLVCAGTGFKLGKKFPNLVALVQHARKILKTKRRPEHRGYGRAVCVLLGWDPSRDPVRAGSVTLRPQGCIPPPGEELQDKEETGSELMEFMDGKLEVKDENKNDDNGFKAKEDKVIETGGEAVVAVASVQGSANEEVCFVKEQKEKYSTMEEERTDSVKGENDGSAIEQDNDAKDGEDAKDDVATDEDVSDLEEACSLRDNDNDKLSTATHDPSLATVSSG